MPYPLPTDLYKLRADAHALIQAAADIESGAAHYTQPYEDAYNEWCERAHDAMTNAQTSLWDEWCLKATQAEVIGGALRILAGGRP